MLQSSGSVYTLLLLLSNNTTTNNPTLCNQLTLLQQHFYKWFEIIQRPCYLKVIYYLVCNGVGHVSGLSKVFNEDKGNTLKILNIFQRYGIVEHADSNDIDVKELRSHRSVFNIPFWQSKKMVLYRLTSYGKAFYSSVPFDKFLPPHLVQMADVWKQRLRKSHSEIAEEESNVKKILDGWFSLYQQHRDGLSDSDNVSWLQGKIEKLAEEKSIIIKRSAEELLSEFKQRNLKHGQ